MSPDLTVIWAFVVSFTIAAYVVMDGFDLGIGILFPAFRVGKERDMAMNAIAPVWDGNETWLILGGNALFAAFPIAYAIILPALYAPLIAMLLGLVFRGVAFEFRWRDANHRRWWDAGFFLGSAVATVAQGITLGALLQGITVTGRAYGGGWWDWLTPFSLLTGVSLLVGYAMLGAAWLIWKTEGPIHVDARRYAKFLLPALLVMLGAVSLYTPFLDGQYWRRWVETPGLFVALPMPLLVAGAAWMAWRSLSTMRDWHPFAWTLAIFALSMAGLAISTWPDVIPGRLTIWQAAAPERSQMFMLVGSAVLIPLIVAYTTWSYYVFRGKVGTEGYHEH
ncbi:MAG: Cytochrome bd terminal oxidase subunit II [uncultured Sphingomonadaceae bacterium]|uniref:Cytochrome bd terminal oxidase subunit II n=1 Tax=uncultured Sphingomonadaceae bacterium TaxID=169976 RepID=A0A6J4T2D0_9SPHN|nr:MAG: Cytochrome bd terminal oxidase subunit II [uncultured Sphingomonadaceae bacterium]